MEHKLFCFLKKLNTFPRTLNAFSVVVLDKNTVLNWIKSVRRMAE